MEYRKQYVDVITHISKEGRIRPMAVIWDEIRYPVERILSIRETHSLAGGCGICYRCQFHGQIRLLYWERDRWFLELGK
jgi:hypothetical protein